jgi:phage gp36-like protein
MSIYCTPEDIEIQIGTTSLIQLTNDDCSQQTVDTVVVEEALIYSSTLIDGYLRGNYTLPLNTQFPLLRVVAIDLSIYRLYSRRIYTDIPETIIENYRNAIKTLEQLKKGVITLETDTNSEVKSSGEYRTNKTTFDRLFSKKVINIEY